MDSNQLYSIINDHLLQEGLSISSADLAKMICQELLSWKVPDSSQPDQTDMIIAFSFGFAFDPNGNRKPGQINHLLADKVNSFYTQRPRPVYAQWEIAESLKDKVRKDHLFTIYPVIQKEGTVSYLSTKGVLDQVYDLTGNKPGASVLLIAHRDHLPRCVKLAVQMGFHAEAVQSEMPQAYDPSSGQYWTRNRETYLISDMISRLASLRQSIVEQPKENRL